MTEKKKRMLLIIISIILMIIGTILYVLFNRNVWVTQLIFSLITIPDLIIHESFPVEAIRNYGADLLWSTAFTVMTQSILWKKRKDLWILLFCCLLGTIYELMQLIGVAKGTADYSDVLIYLCGSLVGILIILGGRLYEKC